MGILVFILKALVSYGISCLAKRIGHTATVEHVMTELENAKPLIPDPNPSPASLRRPKGYEG